MVKAQVDGMVIDENDQVIVEDALEFYLNTCWDDYEESPEEMREPYESKLLLYYQLTGRDFFGPGGLLTKEGVLIDRT